MTKEGGGSWGEGWDGGFIWEGEEAQEGGGAGMVVVEEDPPLTFAFVTYY